MLEKMVEVFKTTTEADKIDATPSFVINGEKAKNMAYPAFAAHLDKLLG